MRRILILDDEPGVLNALQRALRLAFTQQAITIETFADPEAAVLRAAEQDFDVVISDYCMPGLNGADVLHLIKGLQPDAVRIVISASTEYRDIIAAVNRAEAFRYLTKPWEQEELVNTMHEAFRRRDSRLQTGAGPAAPPVAPPLVPEAASAARQQRVLYELEQQEPGITYVDRDEDGNIRLS